MTDIIINYGTMGLVFNFAPNYGTQVAVEGVGGPAVGAVYNYSVNYGLQAGVWAGWGVVGG